MVYRWLYCRLIGNFRQCRDQKPADPASVKSGMNEISGLGSFNTPFNPPEPPGSTVNVFGRQVQLIAQTPADEPREQSLSEGWTSAREAEVTEILSGTRYVENELLTDAGRATVADFQQVLQQQFSTADISPEMAAAGKLVWEFANGRVQLTPEIATGISHYYGAILSLQAGKAVTGLAHIAAEGTMEVSEIETLHRQLSSLRLLLGTDQFEFAASQYKQSGVSMPISMVLNRIDDEADRLVFMTELARQKLSSIKVVSSVAGFLENSLNSEQLLNWETRLQGSGQALIELLYEAVENGQTLDVDRVSLLVRAAAGRRPGVEALQIDNPEGLVHGEQYEIENTDPVRSLKLLYAAMQLSGESPGFYVSLRTPEDREATGHAENGATQKSASFQVYWHGETDSGTQFFTPDGHILRMQQSEHGRLVPVLPTPQGEIPLDQLLQQQKNGRPLIQRLIVSNAQAAISRPQSVPTGDVAESLEISDNRERELYNLPTETQIERLLQALNNAGIQSISELHKFFTDNEIGREATAAMMRAEPVAALLKKIYADSFTQINTTDELTRLRLDMHEALPGLRSKTQRLGLSRVINAVFNQALRNMISGEINLQSANLNGTDLSELNLTNADLTALQFQHGNFSNTMLQAATLRGALLLAVNFSGAQLQGADLSDADLRFSRLVNADMSGADLSGTNLQYLDLTETNLKDVKHSDTTRWDGALLTNAQIQALGLQAANVKTPDGSLNHIDWGVSLLSADTDSMPEPVQQTDLAVTENLIDPWESPVSQGMRIPVQTPSQIARVRYPGLEEALTEFTMDHVPLSMLGENMSAWVSMEAYGGMEEPLGSPEPGAEFTLNVVSPAKLKRRQEVNSLLQQHGFSPQHFGMDILATKYLGTHGSLPTYVVGLNRISGQNIGEEIEAGATYTVDDINLIRDKIREYVTNFANADLYVDASNYVGDTLVVHRNRQGNVSGLNLINPTVEATGTLHKAMSMIRTLARIETGVLFMNLNAEYWQALERDEGIKSADYVRNTESLGNELGFKGAVKTVDHKINALNAAFLFVNKLPQPLADSFKALVRIGVKASGLTAEDLQRLQPGAYETLTLADVFEEEDSGQGSNSSDAPGVTDNSDQTTDSLASPAPNQTTQSNDNPIAEQFGTNNEDSTVSTQLPGGSSAPDNQPGYTRLNINGFQQDENQPGGFSARPTVTLPQNPVESFQQHNQPQTASDYTALPPAIRSVLTAERYMQLDLSADEINTRFNRFQNLHPKIRADIQFNGFSGWDEQIISQLERNSAHEARHDADINYHHQKTLTAQQLADSQNQLAEVQRQQTKAIEAARAANSQRPGYVAEPIRSTAPPAQWAGDQAQILPNDAQNTVDSPNLRKTGHSIPQHTIKPVVPMVTLPGKTGSLVKQYQDKTNSIPRYLYIDTAGQLQLHAVVEKGSQLDAVAIPMHIHKAPINASATAYTNQGWTSVPQLSELQKTAVDAYIRLQQSNIVPVMPAPAVPAPSLTAPVNVPVAL